MDSGGAPSTEVEVWSALDGVTARVGDANVALSPNGTMTVSPALTATGATLVLERDGTSVELPVEFSYDYDMARVAHDEPLQAITLIVMANTDGSCTVGTSNAMTASGAQWAGDYTTPIAACGPFR